MNKGFYFSCTICKETQHRITSCTNSVVNTERWNSEHFAENIKKKKPLVSNLLKPLFIVQTSPVHPSCSKSVRPIKAE